jgi:hypothetical protein
VKQAEECGLLLKGLVYFRLIDYPSYTNRRGARPEASERYYLEKCQTYKFFLGPDILYKWELMGILVVLPNVSSKSSIERFNEDILEYLNMKEDAIKRK